MALKTLNKLTMKKLSISIFLLLVGTLQTQAFCGFYVAKANGNLFNESSQVIIARDDQTQQNTITMSNDYKGDFNEFAMVVPVPVVLMEKDIRVVNTNLFSRFDDYSAPRLAEYYDPNPCRPVYKYENAKRAMSVAVFDSQEEDLEESSDKDYGVTIEAQYEVGEYDILILSAKESDGLEKWLTTNGYKIPQKAQEVLTPYVKDKMKFFVAKVNLKRAKKNKQQELNPIQISFINDKFMLPIRLGMANSKGTQDMIVYLLTKNGRVETTNYQTKKMPSNQKVPLFINQHFGSFYKSVFSKAWTNNKSSVFLEYSWDLNGRNFTKCDPCNTTPPASTELKTAGVNWLSYRGNSYQGNLHFTRLHVRYDRKHFPQDLAFMETKNKQNFQCRYVLNHPAKVNDKNLQSNPKDPDQPIVYGGCDVNTVLGYYQKVQDRRKIEIDNLAELTWWEVNRYQPYLNKYQNKIDLLSVQNNPKKDEDENGLGLIIPKGNIPPMIKLFSIGFIMISMSFLFLKKQKTA